jgi:glycosyltransferase involved in cell wall biosynthesis
MSSQTTGGKMKTPLVSVIMPVYNCEAYIDQALDSLVNQTHKNLEVIVVDDCSKDATWKHLQKWAKKDSRIKPFHNKENLRIVKTLNFAIEQSRGNYLARMDGDDERLPDSIEKQVAFLEANPDVVIVGGTSQVCDENLKPINLRQYPETDSAIRQKMFRFSPFTHPTVMIRKSTLPRPAYDEKFDWAEDYDLYFRLAKFGKLANLSDILYKLRTHKESVSRTKARQQEKLTLYIRLKAVFEYGFTMRTGDKFYFVAQLISMYLMPTSFRFWLFNKIRMIMK